MLRIYEPSIFDSTIKRNEIMTTIKIHPSVKSEIENTFGVNPLSEILINVYEGVYNLAFKDGYSLEEGHKVAMKSLVKFAESVK